MHSAWMHRKPAPYSAHRSSLGNLNSKLLLMPLVALAVLSASCGPDGKMPWSARGAAGSTRNTTPGPLAGAMPPFSTGDTSNSPGAAPGTADATGVDARVQSFVGRFPADDRDRERRATPSQTPEPPAQAAQVNAPPAPAAPKPATPEQAVAQAPTKPPAPTTQPAVAAMRPVDTTVVAPTSASGGGTDAQASPQPLVTNMLAPLPEPGRPRVELIDVRPASAVPTTMPSGETDAAPPANQPVQHAGAPRGNDLPSLLAQLEEEVQAHPEQLDNQFKLRLLYLATDQDDKAAGAIAAGDPIQAHLATALFELLTSAKTAIRQPTTSPAPALLAAEEVRRVLSQQTPVVIPKIALVTRVNSFGDYEAVNPMRFAAGQGVHVYLYTEVANFRSEPTPDGRLRTLLSETVEIYDSTGKVIWKQKAENIEDKVLSPRRDFFIPVEVRLPADTPAGEYTLKAGIEDKLGATTDQQRMTFTIE